MQKLLTAVLAMGCVFGSSAVRGGDRDDDLAIIDQAIQAQGGADALAKLHTAVRRGEGVLYQGDDKLPFTDEMTFDLPDRWRFSVEIEKNTRIAYAVAGDKGWESIGGKADDLGAERLKELHGEIYVLWLETLLPLKKDGIDLTPLPEIKVNGQPAVGVKGSSQGLADVNIYFDKGTHLLAKLEWTAREAGLPRAKEYLLGDYKEFDGVQMPTHLIETTDGKKSAELLSASYKFPSKADDAAFAKP